MSGRARPPANGFAATGWWSARRVIFTTFLKPSKSWAKIWCCFAIKRGKIGLTWRVTARIAARRLEYGDIEDGGIRCPYHGWLFDVRGQCLEMPAEPKDSKFRQKVKHLSYPVREQGGLIFAYLGPDQDEPAAAAEVQSAGGFRRAKIVGSDARLRLQLVQLHRERRRPGALFDPAPRRSQRRHVAQLVF